MLVTRYQSRSKWDARAPNCSSALPVSQVERIFIHYTAADADEQNNHANCAGRVKWNQNFHLDTRGWCDIAYSFAVCKHGHVFEGRGFGVKTAATGPCNNDSYAIVFLGNDSAERDDVTDLGRDGIAEIVAEIERQRGKRLAVHGHRDCMSTACPGDQLYDWLRSGEFRKLVEAQKAPKPTFEWYFAVGGNVRVRATSLRRLLVKMARRPDRHRRLILATKRNRGMIGRRRVPG